MRVVAITLVLLMILACTPQDEAVYCNFNGEVCDMKPQLVCAYLKDCVGCEITVENPCVACNNPGVEYWIDGECE